VGNTIDAAIAHGTHLVYFDNVYAYGPVDGLMTENTPIRPTSKKGRVRAEALAALGAAAAQRGLSFTVARSADFYGPGASTSVFNSFALAKIADGKPGTWLFDADQPHSLSYTPDIGEALATLGTTPARRGEVWHVPTAPAITGREYLQGSWTAATSDTAATADARVNVMGNTMMRIGSLFNSAARETLEMSYQYTAPYLFDSSKFETAFGIAPTPLADGIAASLGAERAEKVL
jgi:nucleoside-diphosphate-sugar epimerase